MKTPEGFQPTTWITISWSQCSFISKQHNRFWSWVPFVTYLMPELIFVRVWLISVDSTAKRIVPLWEPLVNYHCIFYSIRQSKWMSITNSVIIFYYCWGPSPNVTCIGCTTCYYMFTNDHKFYIYLVCTTTVSKKISSIQNYTVLFCMDIYFIRISQNTQMCNIKNSDKYNNTVTILISIMNNYI
jgi:hypothetical protein